MQSLSELLILCSLCPEHWDYHAHPHIHPVEFETLQETNFTELQSVQALHQPALIRHETVRYETEALLDPNLGTHVLQQPVSPSVHHHGSLASCRFLTNRGHSGTHKPVRGLGCKSGSETRQCKFFGKLFFLMTPKLG